MSIFIKNLTKSYHGERVFSQASVNFPSNGIVSLVGPNGSGKTTLMKILAKEEAIDSGEVITQKSKKLIYVPVDLPIYPHMKVEEYLRFLSKIYGQRKKEVNSQVKRVASLFEIEKQLGKLSKNLSKGFRQRVALAGALISLPDVLVLDEPLSGLDPDSVLLLREVLSELKKEVLIILSSHQIDEVQRISDQIYLIENKGIKVLNQSVLEKKHFSLSVRGSNSLSLENFEGNYLDIEIDYSDSEYVKISGKATSFEISKIFSKMNQLNLEVVAFDFLSHGIWKDYIKKKDENNESDQNNSSKRVEGNLS